MAIKLYQVWGIGLIAGVGVTALVHGKNLQPGDILGRDLDYPLLGWMGHVGVATTSNLDDMSYATHVIQAMNEVPAINFVSPAQFRAASKYWGSRFGIAQYDVHTSHWLIAANHQRWWCPVYTSTTDWQTGSGDLYTGLPSKCGKWRCDTFAWWIFADFGHDPLNGSKLITPSKVFNGFPYWNNALMPEPEPEPIVPPELPLVDQELDSHTPEELNNMNFEEFSMIADIPYTQVTPTHLAAEWRLAGDSRLNQTQRGMFIDRISSIKGQKDVVPRLMQIYNETDARQYPHVSEKALQGLQNYYQTQLDLSKPTNDSLILKAFYEEQIHKTIPEQNAGYIVRGYITLASEQEIYINELSIRKLLSCTEKHLAIGLHLQLAHKSPRLQAIYFPNLIRRLKHEQSADMDEMFFGVLAMAHKSLGDEAIQEIRDYVAATQPKYTAKTSYLPNEPMFSMAKKSYQDLVASLGQ